MALLHQLLAMRSLASIRIQPQVENGFALTAERSCPPALRSKLHKFGRWITNFKQSDDMSELPLFLDVLCKMRVDRCLTVIATHVTDVEQIQALLTSLVKSGQNAPLNANADVAMDAAVTTFLMGFYRISVSGVVLGRDDVADIFCMGIVDRQIVQKRTPDQSERSYQVFATASGN